MQEIISIAVVTYNSSKTIVETLDSIIIQDYGCNAIDLIISDDFSTDNTIDIIDSWLVINGKEFHSVTFIKSQSNTGVSANCNRAWKVVKTKWVKSIGGDDLLRINCISIFKKHVDLNQDSYAVFSSMKWFGNINKIVPEKYDIPFFRKSAGEQYEYLKFKSFNLAPTSFLNVEKLKLIGYAEEKFRNIEDLPLWLKFTKNGFKLSFIPVVTVDYRVDNSISKSSTRYVNADFLNDLIEIDRMHPFGEVHGFYSKLLKLDMLTLLYGKLIIKKLTNNKKGSVSTVLDYLLFICRPVYIGIKIKKMLVNKIS